MFPPHNAQVVTNDAGEPIGWDVAEEPEYQDCCGVYGRCVCDDVDDGDEAEPYDTEDGCAICAPFACDDPDRHLGVPSKYTPLKNRGCHCGADLDGRDCMCFET